MAPTGGWAKATEAAGVEIVAIGIMKSIFQYAVQELFHIRICFFCRTLTAASEGADMLVVLLTLSIAGEWQVSKKPDPMTDQVRVVASLRGDNADMIFICGGGKAPVLRYASDQFLGGRGGSRAGRDLTYRFDSAQPVPTRWWYFDSVAEPQNTKDAVAFVTKMIQSSKLAIRALRYDGYYVDSVFDLTGAPAAFHEAFEACGIR